MSIETVIGSEKLLAGTEQAAGNLPQLANAVERLAQGSSALNKCLSSLASGSQGLVEGANALQEGSLKLEKGTVAYTSGVEKAATGAEKIQQGTNQLAANSAQLNSGADQLAVGANRLAEGIPALSGGAASLHEGADLLASGSSKLGGGIGQLEEGSSQLAASLFEGADEINGTHTTDANYEMIAAPATATENQQSEVPNSGHARAPYILSLGLFVGALSFNLVFPINELAGRPTSGTAWWLSKFSLGFVQAASSALIVDAIMLFGFHLQVEHIGEFIAVSIVTSLTYMFLIMFLGMTFGNPGRFAAMIILVLQLGASGGMFPVELTNSFFRTVHDYIPMSYALIGFREAMSSAYGSEAFINSISILGGFFLLFNILLWLVLSTRNRKQFKTVEEN